MSTESNQNTPNPENVQQTQQVHEEKTTQEAVPQQEIRSPKRDENFRRMEKKMRELEEKLRLAELAKQQATSSSEIEDTDLLTVGQMKKLMEEQLRQRELSTLEDRLNAKFPDYAQVVSEDAVEDLREQHPELFNSLKANPDPYQKAIAAYKLIKNMSPKPDMTTIKQNQQKIEENRSKPNMTSTTRSVLAEATGWVKPSKEQKNQIYQEMKQAAAKRG